MASLNFMKTIIIKNHAYEQKPDITCKGTSTTTKFKYKYKHTFWVSQFCGRMPSCSLRSFRLSNIINELTSSLLLFSAIFFSFFCFRLSKYSSHGVSIAFSLAFFSKIFSDVSLRPVKS